MMHYLKRICFLIVASSAAMFAIGCESAQKGGGGAGLNQAISDYNANRFAQAKDRAVAVQERAKVAGEREDAAYLAGLAAYRLGQTDEAERRFVLSSKSTNAETAARSKAMLGQIRLDQQRGRDAAALFVEAHPHLHGDDARQCAYNASVAYQQAGDNTSAQKWFAESGSAAPRSTLSSVASTSGSSNSKGGFTLQVGAFHEKPRAQQAAAEAQKLATRDGLGSVRVVTRRDQRGKTLYIVQFGSFQSREAAAAARTKLNRKDYIVSPV